ncbi:Uncharacterized protein conserved in bacteria [Streptococcus sanguinis]|uniref:Uncharacterized protein conserved in bacteria n=1 Tax=Streptococcus sanguinis TaxID=1305 RepID=A0AAJ5T9Z3_STRSA|nr:DUF4176 domain-containing protein [Streptococcus sanguinis]VDY71357.1 Uncharacterized protein conserved in bacteria [Streptococcus sanguinis]
MTGTKELESFRTVLSTWPNTDFEITDTVVKFGEFLGDRPPLMRELYKLIKLKKSQYEYNSLLGTTILFNRTQNGQITFSFNGQDQVWSEDSFFLFLAILDVYFGKIYPLGSVVEIDLDLLNSELKEMFSEEPGALVMLTGRKAPLAEGFDPYVIDYFGRVWPFGEVAAFPPVFVSNMMIKNVVHLGYENEWEERISEEVIRQTYIKNHQLSTAFMTMVDQLAYLAFLNEKVVEKEGLDE